MKILIKENQLEKIIFAFLNTQFMPHTVIDSSAYDEHGIWWIKNNRVICDVDENPIFKSIPRIWIDEQIYNGFKAAFSLSDYEAKIYLKDYFNKNHNLKYYEIFKLDMSGHQEEYERSLNQD